MLNSDYREVCAVTLPYKGRQKYMHGFDLADPKMAEGFEDYEGVVRSLCRAVGATTGMAYMTVDEKLVQAGMSQRRPKPHVDGCFMPTENSWGHGGGGWLHVCNNIGGKEIQRMSVIVAGSVKGCRAWKGQFYGSPKSDGDLSHIQDQLQDGEVFKENVGYLLSPDCVHESMVMEKPVERTFLRIALPVDFRFNASEGSPTNTNSEGSK